MPKPLFKKGQSGNPNGRPKGAKNKVRFDVADILGKLDCDPFLILAKLAMTSDSEKIRCQAASELAGYVAPKLKSIEHSDGNKEIDEKIEIMKQKFDELAQQYKRDY